MLLIFYDNIFFLTNLYANYNCMYMYFKIIQTITEFDTFVQLISLKKLL